MDCRSAKDNINLYVDNMLSDAQTSQLLSHIKSCDECKKEFDSALLLKKAFDGLEDIEPPAGLSLSAIKKAKIRKFPIFAYASIGIAAVAALVIVFSSGIMMNNSMNDSTQEQMALSEPRNGEAAKTQNALFLEEPNEVRDEAAGVYETTSEQEAEEAPAMEADMAQESMESDEGAAAAPEPMQDDDQRVCCNFTFSGIDAQIFGQIFDAFIEDYDIAADYLEFDSGRTVSFVLYEDAFDAFEALIYKDNLLYEGELYPGCYIQITFYE